MTTLLTSLFRDPARLRHRLLADARVGAGVLGVGGAAYRYARAGAGAALTYGHKRAAPDAAAIAPQLARLPAHAASRAVVTELVYELLDAHDDTAQMAASLACDPAWRNHLDYLQALQRKGRETLAHAYIGSAQ